MIHALARPWGEMHLRVEARGAGGLPAVFLHSLGADLRMWDDCAEQIEGLGTRVRIDFRGHGLSAVSAPFSIQSLAEDVLAALDDAGLERALIVGCSVGGLVAQKLALETPDRVLGLVISNSLARLGNVQMWHERIAQIEARGMEAMADEIVKRWFAPPMFASKQAALWRNAIARTPKAGYTALCAAIAQEDLSAQVGAISVPCLVLAGSFDQSTPPDQVRALAQSIPGACFHEYPDCGHLPATEQPQAFARSVSNFIQDTPFGRSPS